MFEGLKKKFSEVIKGFVKKEEQAVEAKEAPEAIPTPRPEAVERHEAKESVAETGPKAESERVPADAKPDASKEGGRTQRHDLKHPVEPHEQKAEAEHVKKEEAMAPRHATMQEEERRERKATQKQKDGAIKLSLATKVKKAVFGSVVLSGAEIERFLSGLRISMLESDVAFDVAESFIDDLGTRLKGKRIESKSINAEVVSDVREALLDTLKKGSPGFSLVERVKSREEGPFVILFLGPNGTGKTTTIAKIASRLKRQGLTSVISASDTFRAAAIEQMVHHANRIGVPVIKSVYGADPASIAFDAVAYARARNLDAVLIDSAGRQETNPSLIREMEKMVRVAKPGMTIFVGESTAGNAIANQIVEFGKHIRIDGIILTKLDCDAKGGGALSISHLTGMPILFFGVGEGYDALVDYTPEFIADAILPKAE